MKKAIPVVLGLFVLVVGIAAFAPGPRGMTPERAYQMVTWRLDDALDALDATSAQRDALHALKDGLFAEAEALRREVGPARRALLEEWRKDVPDRERIHRLVDEGIERARALAHKAADAALEAHEVLTPEQREQVAKQAERRLARRGL